MASTSITSVGRVVVVTQVIPQEEAGIQLQASPTSGPAPPPAPAPSLPTDPPVKVDEMTAMFLRGQPHALGVIQIFIGLLCCSFSLVAIFSPFLMLHLVFSLAIVFVVSGSLAVHAGRKTTATLVLVTLLWSVLSGLVGVGGVAYVCWVLVSKRVGWTLCSAAFRADLRPSAEMELRCEEDLWNLNSAEAGALSLLLILLVLLVCVVVTVSVFSGRALPLRKPYRPVVMVESGRPEGTDSDASLLDNEELDSP